MVFICEDFSNIIRVCPQNEHISRQKRRELKSLASGEEIQPKRAEKLSKGGNLFTEKELQYRSVFNERMFATRFTLSRKAFGKLKDVGKLYQSDSFGVLVRHRENIGNPRFGIIISNKVSKLSVHRNRARRAFRDVLRRNWKKVNDGIDLVFLIKPAVERVPVSEIMKEVERFIDSHVYDKKIPREEK